MQEMFEIRQISRVWHAHFLHQLRSVDIQRLASDSFADFPKQNEAEIAVNHLRAYWIHKRAIVGPMHYFLLCLWQCARIVRLQASIMQQQIPQQSRLLAVIGILRNVLAH